MPMNEMQRDTPCYAQSTNQSVQSLVVAYDIAVAYRIEGAKVNQVYCTQG